MRPPQTSAVLHRAQPSQLLFRPLLVVVSQIGVEHSTELGYRHARPVPMVEEFILEPAKESLHRRVVRAAPLLRHRPGQVVFLADRDPSRPAVMAPAIGVRDGTLPFGKRAACGLEAAVGELRVRARADRPGGQAAVEAVEDRGQVHLAARQPELGNVKFFAHFES